MNKTNKPRRWLSLLLAAAIAVPVFGTANASVNAEPSVVTAAPGNEGYFGAKYPALAGKDHVFETATYYELDYLLRNATTGANDNYVILFGGSWQPETQAAIGYINDVAQEYGITSIKNFDTRLAGPNHSLDITKASGDYGDFTRRYVDLGARYLTNINDHAKKESELGTLFADYTATGDVNPPGGIGTKTVDIVDAPFLFIYNKGNAGGPIVASLEGIGSAGSLEALQNGTGADAYKTALRGVFDTISEPETKNAHFKVLTNQEYIPGSYNEFSASNIFDGSDPAAVIDSVTLDELKYVLGQDGTFAVFIGCAWCGDSQGIVKYLNKVASEYGVDKVYNWDFKLDGGVGGLTSTTRPSNPRYSFGETLGGSALHTRTKDLSITHIYTDFVNQYLTNLVSQDTKRDSRITGTNPVTDAAVSSARVQAPYIFVYDKRNVDTNGNPAPILGHVELMGGWSVTGDPNSNAAKLRVNSLQTLFSRIEWKPTGLTAVSPSYQGYTDGAVEGIENKALEYRLKGTSNYTAVPTTGNRVENLAPGVYEFRYAKKFGFDTSNNVAGTAATTEYSAGPAVEIEVLPSQLAAPSNSGYFRAKYPALAGKDHVFETATYYELDYLLRNATTGANDNYVILFGGSWQPETQAAIGYINDVAKEYGITSIKNFDTRLAGPDHPLDITKVDALYGDFTRRYVDLGARYLTNLNGVTSGDLGQLSANYTTTTYTPPGGGDTITYTPPGGAGVKNVNIAEAPFLFIYNKGNTAAPIIASLEGIDSAGSLAALQSGSGAEAYKTALRGVFDTISPAGTKNAQFKRLTNQEYIPNSYNEFSASNIFDESDPAAVIDSVTLDELKYVLDQDGTFAVFIGCAWCGDSQGIVKYLNKVASEYGVDKVYNWDFKLDGGVGGLTSTTRPANPRFSYGETLNGNALHTRQNNLAFTHVFTDFVNGKLTNLVSQDTKRETPNRIVGTNPVTNEAVSSSRVQAPYIFVYDKRNVDTNGNPAPILGHVELMGGWSVTGEPNSNAAKLRVSSLQTLFSRIEWKPTGLTAVSPSYQGYTDGAVEGIENKALEYRLKGTVNYTAVPTTGNRVENLAPGTYEFRYAKKFGFDTSNNGAGTAATTEYSAGPAVEIEVLPSQVAAPPSPPAGGGGTTPTPELVTELDNGARAEVKATLDEASGTWLAAIPDNVVNALLEKAKKAESEGKGAALEIRVDEADASGNVQVTLTRGVFDTLVSGSKASLTINVGFGSITFDAEALGTIAANEDGGDISFIVSKSELTEEGKEILGDRPVYDLLVFAGQSEVSSFGGSVVDVFLPYELKRNEDPNAIIVYYVNEDGELQLIEGKYNASKKGVTFATEHFSQYIVGYNKIEFEDVASSAWYASAVSFLAAREITNGTDETHFSPNANVTRGQFIVLLLNAYGIEADGEDADNFADAGNTYYTGYLAAAKRLGIANGYEGNRFAPNDSISRQELFTLLYRALTVLGKDPVAESDAASLADFSDTANIAGYALEALEALVEAGVVSGLDGKLNPGAESTRAQVAQVLYNLLSK